MNNINVLHSRTIGLFRLCLALASLLWVGALVSRADTHYVSLIGTNDSDNGYITWGGAATNIQWAVDKATTAGDTVLVSNGTYNLTNQISIAANITVRSLYGTNNINTSSIINGNNYVGKLVTNRCIYMTKGVVDGFVISNGYTVETATLEGGAGIQMKTANVSTASVYNCIIGWNICANTNSSCGGGGIWIEGNSSVRYSIVTNCAVISNTVNFVSGGGIYSKNGGLIVASRISGNKAPSAGGIIITYGGMVSNCIVDNNLGNNYGGVYLYGTGPNSIMVKSVVSNNVSYADAGGIYLYPGGTVLDSTITGNTASNSGGGVYFSITGGSMISNCLVTANTAIRYYGGGIYLGGNSGPGVVSDCTIAGNVANTGGGGLYVTADGDNSQLVKNCLIYCNTNMTTYGGGGVYLNWTGPYPYGLINCTIVSNQANILGGGLSTATYSNYIANCIIYGNVTTNDVNDEVYVLTAGGTNNFWYNCAPTNLVLGQGNTTNNPRFIDAVNRNYRLGSGSPCVNAGTNMNWMTNSIDLDRRIRIRYDTVDMGAYEAIYNGTMYGVR